MNLSYHELLDELMHISSIRCNKNANIIVKTKLKFLGVYIPGLKKLANKYKNYNFIDFKLNEYFEINFIFVYANLLRLKGDINNQINWIFKYENLFDNWEIIDCIAPLFKDAGLDTSLKLINSNKEFIIRLGYVILLPKVRNEMMINDVFNIIIKDERYYVTMAEGWLISECLISSFSKAFELLKSSNIPQNVKLIAIQKAIDSFRVTDDDKNKLRQYRKIVKGVNL